MSATLHGRLAASRRRRAAIVVALGLAPVLAVAALAARLGGSTPAMVIALLGFVAVVACTIAVSRRIGLADIVRALDAAVPGLEDSSDLLLAEPDDLTPLAHLQRERVAARLAGARADVRKPWPTKALAATWGVALVAVVLAAAWPVSSGGSAATVQTPSPAEAIETGPTRLVASTLAIEPPAYTALPARSEASLEARAPQGSRLRWSLRIAPMPDTVALAFHDGRRLELARDGDGWNGETTLDASTLYRVEVGGIAPLADAALNRLDAVPDEPPQVRVIEPERTLSVLDRAQPIWRLVFEAGDDYGLASARLSITLAQGSGEQVTVKESSVVLRGEGDARKRRYTHALDLTALGFAQGDDLIVRVAVADNRVPEPNVTRSASFILRWPPDLGAEASGIDGIVQKTLPAYFRSQRQIIIDTEALLAERGTLDEARFLARSDAIGVDQKILRLRYGQFLGEEFESGATPPPAAAKPDDETSHDGHDHDEHGDEPHAHEESETADASHAGHDHDHGAAPGAEAPRFGDAAGVIAEYGHTHDHAEAATLLDPETKRILKTALDAMWQAELQLRSGHPREALPHENRALAAIKQVQQATRIYLARVGLELPPVDETRRLTGERAGVRDRRASLAAATPSDAVVAEVYGEVERGGLPDTAALEVWMRSHPERVDDVLGIVAAFDALRRDTACADCRARVLDRLWPLLRAPAPAVRLRETPDAAGRAYLDALGTGEPR
ncbi:DUF4175 family protein [Dokdonella sp. MW10]|uniref:DUF4175 family protein n=1 Tax=Dokdonella sp. MW10 TaxID=2992926 RepID=UPI003F803B59